MRLKSVNIDTIYKSELTRILVYLCIYVFIRIAPNWIPKQMENIYIPLCVHTAEICIKRKILIDPNERTMACIWLTGNCIIFGKKNPSDFFLPKIMSTVNVKTRYQKFSTCRCCYDTVRNLLLYSFICGYVDSIILSTDWRKRRKVWEKERVSKNVCVCCFFFCKRAGERAYNR